MSENTEVEIERKWIVPVDCFDSITGNFSATDILQFYNEKGERFRQSTSWENSVPKYQKTIKGDGGLVRPESNTDISHEEFLAECRKNNHREPIRKIRFTFPHGDLKIELDKFSTGEFYAEIEFKTEEQALAFTDTPDWFGREVTGDNYHSNYAIFRRMQLAKSEEQTEDK